MFWLKIALGVWALVFVLLVVPFTQLNAWKVGKLPVVEGTLSNHRIVEVKRPKSRTTESWVKATLEFDRPSDRGLVHCRQDDVTIGLADKPQSFATHAELAVRKDSCYGYSFLPLHVPSFAELTLIFVAVGLYLVFLIAILFFAIRYQKPVHAGSAVADTGERSDRS